MEKETVAVRNRYGEEVLFVRSGSKIMMSFPGKVYRSGLKNDYSVAFEEFKKSEDYAGQSLEWFEDVALVDLELWDKYFTFIVSTKETAFIDPSGGPCVSLGTDLGDSHGKMSGLVVESITTDRKGNIILKV